MSTTLQPREVDKPFLWRWSRMALELVVLASRGLPGAYLLVAAMCSASLLIASCASSGSSEPLEVAGYAVTIAPNSECRAMQGGSAKVRPARDLPPFLPSDELTYYPDEARRLGQKGFVDLTFAIDGEGRAVHIKQVCYTLPLLRESAVRGLASSRFRVPPNWEQAGAASREFAFEFQYRLVIGASTPCGKYHSQRIPDAKLVRVCGRLIFVR